MEQFDSEYQAYLQQMAAGNVTNGVIYEPRAFFDFIQLSGTLERKGHAEVFKNGEQFPIVLTHMTAAVSYLNQNGSTISPERNIQRVGCYLQFHDQYYMNPPQQLGGGTIAVAAPLPSWNNVPVGGAEALTRGTSTWKFPRPFILSARDTMRVGVRLYAVPAAATPVTVAFTGIGLISRQPYFFSGTVQPTNASWVDILPESFQNDGVEPVAITDMVVSVQADIEATDPTGDVRRVFIRVRQHGNGTGAAWFHGPLNVGLPGLTGNVPEDAIAVSNLGVTLGRSVVHKFPEPLIWEPGEGIQVTAQALQTLTGDVTNVTIALLGYITVQ